MSDFDTAIQQIAATLTQSEGATLVIAVTDDTVLRDYAIDALRGRLEPELRLHDVRYDPEHLSLLEAAVDAAARGSDRAVISVAGIEGLPRDQRTEAIRLL